MKETIRQAADRRQRDKDHSNGLGTRKDRIMIEQDMPKQNPISQPIEDAFVQSFEETRKLQYEKGIQEYGIPLMTFNGRDAHLDAMQEHIDLGRYLTQMQMEREHLEKLLHQAHDFLASLVLPSSRQSQLHEVLQGLCEVLE